MSEQQPPSGMPEYLESGGGSPIPPQPDAPVEAPAGRRSRRSWWIGGGVVVLLGLGAGAWAALSFFQQGSQPAEALPASTVAYLSIDLDPAGGQKIDAFRTLNKFPSFKHDVGVGSVDELRHKLGNALVSSAHCPGVDYDQDIDPWLGDRAAIALVDLPSAKPDAVAVVQVKDEAKARDALSTLDSCATDRTGHTTGFVVDHGWAVLADTQQFAEQVDEATAQGTLADDATYQKWTKALGEPGVVNAYAAPDAGRLLAEKFRGELGWLSPSTFTTPDATALPELEASASASGTAFHAAATDDPFTEALSGFKGGAATLRFTGDGVELVSVADGSDPQLADLAGNTGGSLVQRLPDDTAAAIGVTLPRGWLERRLDQLSTMFGAGISGDDMRRELSHETGLTVPDDIETLLGSGAALSVSKDIDLEAAENSSDGSGIPLALTVKGDPPAIEQVLGKLRAKTGDLPFLGSDSSGDLEVIGPSADYRKQVLAGGSLGDDDTFRSVVPDAADGGWLFYVDVDALEPALAKVASGQDLEDLTPLRAVGMSVWNDHGTARFSFKLSTN